MKSQRFGIEIEMTGLTRRSAALIIAKQALSMNVVYMIPILSVIRTEENGKLYEMQVLHRNVEIDLTMILIIK